MQLVSSYCSEPPPEEKETFTLTIENVSQSQPISASGGFSVPEGSDDPGPLLPGKSYVARFGAPAGSHLSFATMFVQSNDLFIAPGETGIRLFDSHGDPRTADITRELELWDAGTELNEPPGGGMYQPVSQPGPNTGPEDDDPWIRLVDDGYTYPATRDMIKVTLTHEGDNQFRLEIANIAPDDLLQTPEGGHVPVIFAPGVFAVHGPDFRPLFTEGTQDRSEGLEALAEDGGIGDLTETLANRRGLFVPLSPGVVVTHDVGHEPIFTPGEVDRGAGLEGIAEDGNPGELAESLMGDAFVWDVIPFNTPVGADAPAPIFSGERYSVTFMAAPGEALSLATMFISSNDGFYAAPSRGIDLFDPHGDPIEGDITSMIGLWDAGTELNQMPGTGPNQPLNGVPGGEADDTPYVRLLDDGYTYPATRDVIKVSLYVQ